MQQQEDVRDSGRLPHVLVLARKQTGGIARRIQFAQATPRALRALEFTQPALAQLTRLQLRDCVISLRVLYLATALQRLALCSTAEPDSLAGAYASSVQWGRLVQLTQLQVMETLEPGGLQVWEVKGDCLKSIRHLTRLKVRAVQVVSRHLKCKSRTSRLGVDRSRARVLCT